MSTLREIWILPIIQQHDVIMTSGYVIVSIKFCSEVWKDKYIIVCYFGGRRMNGF